MARFKSKVLSLELFWLYGICLLANLEELNIVIMPKGPIMESLEDATFCEIPYCLMLGLGECTAYSAKLLGPALLVSSQSGIKAFQGNLGGYGTAGGASGDSQPQVQKQISNSRERFQFYYLISQGLPQFFWPSIKKIKLGKNAGTVPSLINEAYKQQLEEIFQGTDCLFWDILFPRKCWV